MTIKICIIAHNSYGALTGGSSGHFGGVERQTLLMSKWLQKNDYEVSILTWKENNKNDEIVNSLKILKLCSKNQGIPIIKFFYPRWYSLIDALKKANADIYYHNCAEYVTGQIALWCKLNNKKFIYSVASDADCDPNLPALNKFRERILYKYGIKNADKIIVQTHHQKTLLEKYWGLKSKIIPMPCQEPDVNLIIENERKSSFTCIWVGRIVPLKRLEILLEVAKKMPMIKFKIAGSPDKNTQYTENLVQSAKNIHNIELLGNVSHQNMAFLYANSNVLINTSSYEGFPNTFLEAWSYGLPIISFVDPDNLISNYRLGFKVNKITNIVNAIEILNSNEIEFATISRNCRNYYLRNHTTEKCMIKFQQNFNYMIRK